MNLQMQAVVVGNIQRALSNRLAGKLPLTKNDHIKAVLLLEQMTGEQIMPPSRRVTDKVLTRALEIADSFMWQIDNHYAEAQEQFQEAVAAYNSGLGD